LQATDAVIITTDHSNYDYEWIVANAKKVVDTRNATGKLTQNKQKVILL